MLSDIPNSAHIIEYTKPALIAPYYVQEPFYPNIVLSKHNRVLRGEAVLAETKINKIELLEENWDGYGAIRISSETAKNTKNAINKLSNFAAIPDITPNSNGTISLEWETPEGYAHLEVGRTKYSFYIKPRSGNPILADGAAETVGEEIGKSIAEVLFPPDHNTTAITKISFSDNDLRLTY